MGTSGCKLEDVEDSQGNHFIIPGLLPSAPPFRMLWFQINHRLCSGYNKEKLELL